MVCVRKIFNTKKGERIRPQNTLRSIAALGDNWDRCGAPRISNRVLRTAHSLMWDLPGGYRMFPTCRNSICLEWSCHARQVNVEVCESHCSVMMVVDNIGITTQTCFSLMETLDVFNAFWFLDED